MADQTTIVVGGPSSGFSFYGPFPFSGEAVEYAETEFRTEPWWVAPLVAPEETEEDAERRVERMASALAMSEGYDPNSIPVNEWAEAKLRYMDRAQKIIDILNMDEDITSRSEPNEAEELESPDLGFDPDEDEEDG